MNVRWGLRRPWALAFSFSRVIQQPALDTWRGADAKAEPAQRALVHRVWCNRAVCQGRHDAAFEAGGIS